METERKWKLSGSGNEVRTSGSGGGGMGCGQGVKDDGGLGGESSKKVMRDCSFVQHCVS